MVVTEIVGTNVGDIAIWELDNGQRLALAHRYLKIMLNAIAAPEDDGHGVSRFQLIRRQAAKARKFFLKDQAPFLSAIKDAPDTPEKASGDDIFGEIDKAMSLKRKEFVKQRLMVMGLLIFAVDVEMSSSILAKMIEITGVAHDSREVCSGYLFVCCVGMKTDGYLFLNEADKRGAVAVVASKEIDIDKTLGCKALAETVVMEASMHGLSLGRCDEFNFDITVFTNLTRDHMDFHQTEYRDAKAKLFANIVDPDRHRKIVKINDPNALFFIAQGNPEVPVVTFAMENKSADVHILKFELSLFHTQVLVNTPPRDIRDIFRVAWEARYLQYCCGCVSWHSCGSTFGRHARRIEEVDGVPGRLLDVAREHAPRRIITARFRNADVFRMSAAAYPD
ncbi:hypothetical protein C5167_013872 [Papaver somniferum]|uniref:Mur ligase central domain-containing protein n=1 Tax=Papaver somniferum TaxID=3469 RepID=A0A4Y7J4M5_PAPSO|nr:hypothetical protein C5167_013872 [Papaver somniferum]